MKEDKQPRDAKGVKGKESGPQFNPLLATLFFHHEDISTAELTDVRHFRGC